MSCGRVTSALSGHNPEAQQLYVDNVLGMLPDTAQCVLDMGCGLHGLSRRMLRRGAQMVALSPRQDHISRIQGARSIACAPRAHHDRADNTHTSINVVMKLAVVTAACVRTRSAPWWLRSWR